jgi:hypothetical protein
MEIINNLPEKGIERTLGKYESAIKLFIKEYFQNSAGYGFDFDISAPSQDDVEEIRSGGDYEITNFSAWPENEEKKQNLIFYVGRTEFHVSGKAINRINELLEEK